MSGMKEWDGTEADALDDQSDYGAADDFAEDEARKMHAAYEHAKHTKTGCTMTCPGCGKRIVKTTYNKVFCSNGRTVKGRSSCKDYFWNVINPRGMAAERAA